MSIRLHLNTSSWPIASLKLLRPKKLQQDDVLPSINELSFEFEISRDTAEKGYRYLKKGNYWPVPGKGYFIKNAAIGQKDKGVFNV